MLPYKEYPSIKEYAQAFYHEQANASPWLYTDITEAEFVEAMNAVEFSVSHPSYASQRARKLAKFAKDNNVAISDVEIEEHNSISWGDKKGRNAIEIGSLTKGRYTRERWWAIIPQAELAEA